MKFKLLAVAAVMATSASSFAAMDGAASGNGSLMVNFITSTGAATSGGDDMSAVFDLGVNMNTVLGWNGVAGFTRTWSLSTGFVSGTGISGNQATGTYGSSWNELLTFAGPSKVATIEFNVIALDNTNKADVAGGSRYLTTAGTTTLYPGLTNGNLNGFDGMDAYVLANNALGTNASAANGASTATPGGNSYFRSVNGSGQGDTWLVKTTVDTAKAITTAQNFYFLTTTAPGGTGASSKTAFGYDLNGNGSIETGEFAQWTVDAAAGTISFNNVSAVPEAETYAMLLAGLGLMGAVVRRRNRAV